MNTRYAFTSTVISVDEKFHTNRVVMIEGKPQEEKESLGWFVRITESSAICVGGERPDIKKGDKVKITLEKVA
jgi:hypothetical protein